MQLYNQYRSIRSLIGTCYQVACRQECMHCAGISISWYQPRHGYGVAPVPTHSELHFVVSRHTPAWRSSANVSFTSCDTRGNGFVLLFGGVHLELDMTRVAGDRRETEAPPG